MAITQNGTHCVKMTAQSDALTGMHHVSYIRWVGANTAGHVCAVSDTSGNVYFASEADGANFIDLQPIFQWRDGVKVLLMDSGTVYVYTI